MSRPGWILFDDCRSVPARGLLFDQAVEWLACTRAKEFEKCLARAQQALNEGLHVAGAFAYELGYVLEERLKACAWPHSDTPLVSLGLFERRRTLAGDEIEKWLGTQSSAAFPRPRPPLTPPREKEVSSHEPARRAHLALPQTASAGASAKTRSHDQPFPSPCGEGLGAGGSASASQNPKPTPRWDFPRYEKAFARVRDYIAAGDVYQVNLTFPLDLEIEGDLMALYRDLRRNAKSRYGAVMVLPEATILSLSPELFFEIENGVIRTRPMKGTVARAAGANEDREVAAALARDEKQCAENLMIVDLLRNDLSRIAEKGSVAVEDLFTVETYPTLHTMTSGIRARLRRDASLRDILGAVFPCGSVTGAPKIRAMEIIRELEPAPRGVYCGALGWFSGRDARLSVAIRTLDMRGGRARLHVGGGLVYDSQGRSEYDEALLKARFLTDPAPPFALIETMRLDAGGIWLLERHLARLRESAAYFLFPFDENAVRGELNRAVQAISLPALAAQEAFDARTRRPPHQNLLAPPDRHGRARPGHPSGGGGTFGGIAAFERRDTSGHDNVGPGEGEPQAYRLRLLLDAEGKVTVTTAPLAREAQDIAVTISPMATSSGDRFLRHKTTRRDLYEREFARAEALGCGEVLFVNERGELTEGSRTNLFVEKDGVLLTPPLAGGALGGCLRAELIARAAPPVIERVLTPADLGSADAVYVGNSLRGLIRARLV